ncbi:potassium channel family protein [Ornithinimicrobium tianjinense]|uniref:Potassium transporter n=1 Tax=Ornithinimicrobium tianjinense TaxID=1195761 RepID=A0A917F7S9_9MICO|nr:TrkA family potassium uptake protein [Ornithinimicrobium tianjinense]GGF51805.1 potassium transporter [Ornithinimicrobium tianjinense]
MARFSKQARAASTDPVLVVGLGRFGSAVCESLVRQGVEVLAVDTDEARVQEYADEFTHTVRADATDGEAMRQLGAGDLTRAVVAIGSDIEASVLSVITLAEAGVDTIYAKAISRKHGKILTSIGATHVIYPEHVMGQRVGHMVTGGLSDYLEFEDEFAIARCYAPEETWDRPLSESAVRRKHTITVVGVKRPGEPFTYAVPETVVHRGDELVLSGRIADVERFTALAPRA